jgi:hypothetical protein
MRFFPSFLLLGNGTEFISTTLHINSSSLHHRTTKESSSNLASFSHLNMNQSRDEKTHNFKTETQGESIRKVSPFKEYCSLRKLKKEKICLCICRSLDFKLYNHV